MPVIRPRNRLVYFRVSEDEFQQFTQICESSGARSISDLARSAMQRMIQSDNHDAGNQLTAKLTVLETIIWDLNHQLRALTALLAGHDGLKGAGLENSQSNSNTNHGEYVTNEIDQVE